MTEGGKFTVIDLGKLSKPMDTLINRIGDATGVWFEPHRIVRKARAEAEAKAISVRAEIETDDLYKRALHRLASEEAKKQENIEKVLDAAIPAISDQSDPNAVDKDWLANFIDKVKTISDEDAQKIWASILSGETNAPGSFSKKTVNLLHEMDKQDATMFNTLMRFLWIYGKLPVVLVFDLKHEIYRNNGLHFGTLEHLSSLGIIAFSNISNYSLENLTGRKSWNYAGRPLHLDFQSEHPKKLVIGHVSLTKTGGELVRVSNAPKVDGFYEYVADRWKDFVIAE